MKKITLLLLLACSFIFAQRVEPTFTWSNKSDYQVNGESAVTFKPGDAISIEIAYTLGSTDGTADAFNFILAGLQDEAQADVDVLNGVWANLTVAQPNDYVFPGAGTAGTVTANYTIPADAELSSENANLTYRILAYMAYTPNGAANPTYGGVGASDPTLVYIRSQAEIDVLSTRDFKKTIAIYPNPVNDVVHLGNDVQTDSYKIMSITGAIVREEKWVGKSLDVSDLKSGMYFLITDSGTAKLLKI